MKAAPFQYIRAASVAEAVEALAGEPTAKVLAGGQSLVPMLAMRLARPRLLVDINRVGALTGLCQDDTGLRVGALVRQRDLELDPRATAVPLVAAALPYIGHRELRNRGTVCGSIAHADPAAELPAVAATLNASLTVSGPAGEREVSARDFFVGPLQTTLRHDEVLTAVRFPVAGPGDGFAFEEVARRHGDFALCGAAVAVHRDGEAPASATVGLFGVGERPVTFEVAARLRDTAPTEAALRAIGEDIAAELTPSDDLHAGAGYRRRLAATLTARCLRRALTDAAVQESR